MSEPAPLPVAGLCDDCVAARRLRSRRSTFLLCTRSASDPAFPRYPRLPVVTCPGYVPAPSAEGPLPPAPSAVPDSET